MGSWWHSAGPAMRWRQPPPRSRPNALPAQQGTLPLPATRFFGRQVKIPRLCETLLQNRLITLTGPAGSGKTRLALEVAQRLREPFQGAVWLVPLAGLDDPRLIAGKALDVLRLPRSPQLDPLSQLVSALSRQPALLLLDTFD